MGFEKKGVLEVCCCLRKGSRELVEMGILPPPSLQSLGSPLC